MKTSIIILFLISLGAVDTSQDNHFVNNDLKYEVNRIYTPLSISKAKLNKAKTLAGLNRNYKRSWVREFISVEVLASNKGKKRRVMSKNDVLSQEQKNIMHQVDVGTEIEIKVQYIPENTLKHNDPKEFSFAFIVNPENEATYANGQEELNQYLKKNAIDKIPNDIFKKYDLAAVKFTVTEKGQIINPHIFESSKDEEIDQLLLNTITNMPDWKPAKYANGTKVKQDFVLTVGNHESCVINLLNIGRLNTGEKLD